MDDKEKSKAIMTMLKGLKVKIKNHQKVAEDSLVVADGIRKGLEEAKLIQSGKLKVQTIEDLLDEL